MILSLNQLRLKSRVVAFTAILLTLWLNIASVEHQIDFSPADHSHHHCQLFAGASHGLTQHIPELPVWISHNYVEPINQILTDSTLYLAYLARSPPYKTDIQNDHNQHVLFV